jgi:hypothetical protein
MMAVVVGAILLETRLWLLLAQSQGATAHAPVVCLTGGHDDGLTMTM